MVTSNNEAGPAVAIVPKVQIDRLKTMANEAEAEIKTMPAIVTNMYPRKVEKLRAMIDLIRGL